MCLRAATLHDFYGMSRLLFREFAALCIWWNYIVTDVLAFVLWFVNLLILTGLSRYLICLFTATFTGVTKSYSDCAGELWPRRCYKYTITSILHVSSPTNEIVSFFIFFYFGKPKCGHCPKMIHWISDICPFPKWLEIRFQMSVTILLFIHAQWQLQWLSDPHLFPQNSVWGPCHMRPMVSEFGKC